MIGDLAPGEHVIWEGRPKGIRGFLRPMDLFLASFILFAALFFVTTLAASRNPPREPSEFVFVALFPIVFFGLFFFMPRFVGILREAQGSSYALTDRRIILKSRGRHIELELRTLPYLELERSWVSGRTIYFAQRNMYEGWGGFYGGSAAPAIRGLADAEEVYRKISTARAQAGR